MTKKNRGLGRGLDALLGAASEIDVPQKDEQNREALLQLPLDLVQRGAYQPRSDMHAEALQELAESVKAQGVVQPILVRAIDDGRYEIIAGERRWRASQMAGLESIPAVVRDVPDQSVLAIALIENIQRENLNPLEEAAAYSRLVNEFELTHAQVAEAVGKSRTTVTNLLRLLELGEDIKRLLESGDLEMGHARALLALQGETRGRAAREVVANGLSVRETETLVRRLQTPDQPTGPAPRPNPDVARLQNDLSERIGARVQIRHGSRGKGTLKIDYNSLDELEGILAHIR